MAGIFKGIRTPSASKSMSAQRYKSGGIVNYEYNPYQRYGWDRRAPAALPERTIDETVVDETVVDNSSSGGGSNNTGIVTPIVTPVDTTPTTTVYDNPYAVIDTPVWAQPESSIVPGNEDFSWDGAGGTSYGDDYSAVIDAANDLPPVTTDSGGNLVPVSAGNFTPVTAYAPEIGDMVDNDTMREIQNAEVERSFENFGENILNNPNLTPAQIAAANPAFNVDAAETHAQVPVTITNPTTGESYVKPAGSLTSEDFANALPGTGGDTGSNYTGVVDDYGYIDSSQGGFSGPGTGGNEALTAQQYALAGQSAAAAGIRNIGGSYAQDGIGSGNAPIVETRYNPATGLSEVIGIEEQVVANPNNDGNPNNDVGNAGWGFTSIADVFDGGGPGASGDSYSGGIHGGNTVGDTSQGITSLFGGNNQISEAQAQQNIADLQAFSSATADRGQLEGKAAAATKQANEYVNEQAEFKSGASEEELAANEQQQLLGDFLWKYEGADTPQMRAHYASQAAEAGLDFEGKSASDFVTSDTVTSADKTKLIADARAAKTAQDQGIKAVDGGLQTAKTTADTALGTDVLASGLTRDETTAANLEGIDLTNESASSQRKDEADRSARQTSADVIATEAAADPSLANLSGDEAKAYLNSVGAGNYAKEDARDALQSLIADGTATPEPVTEAETQTAQQQLAAGVPAEQVRANLEDARVEETTPEPTSAEALQATAQQNLENAAVDAGYTSAVGKVLAEVHGWSAEQIAAAGYNRGGIVHRADGGKINIKPSRKGIFSKKAKDAGQSTQAYARKVMSAKKGIYSPSLRKQANFALNASKWN